MRTNNITTRQSLSTIQLTPLKGKQKEKLLQDVMKGFSEQLSTVELKQLFQDLKLVLKKYIDEYNNNWDKFARMLDVGKFKDDLKIASKNGIYDVQKVQKAFDSKEVSNARTVKQFLRTLEKGFLILEHIRNLLTKQTIETEFTLKNSKGDQIYRVPKSEVPYKLSLSAYGASGNNFISLAYNVQVSNWIKQASEEVKNSTSITGSGVYQAMMDAKKVYLKWKSRKTGKTYSPYFDAKDAEIFDLLSKSEVSFKTFNTVRYAQYRATMGGKGSDKGGGSKVSAMQAGDVGLIQDKLIQAGTNKVNFGRQTLIIRHFEELYQAIEQLKPDSDDLTPIKEKLLELFTVQNKSAISDAITEATNAAAIEVINALFEKK